MSNSTDLSAERLALLDDDRLIALAKNVKHYEKSEDLSDLVLELANRLESAWEEMGTMTVEQKEILDDVYSWTFGLERD